VPIHTKMVARGKVVAAHDGGTRAETDFQRWRFRTVCVITLNANTSNCGGFRRTRVRPAWKRACLHVFKINRETHTSDPIVFLHAEPMTDGGVATSEYKKCLHLHVKNAVDPIPKSHLPLTISHIDNHVEQVLSSVNNLTTVLGKAVNAIMTEVVARYS